MPASIAEFPPTSSAAYTFGETLLGDEHMKRWADRPYAIVLLADQVTLAAKQARIDPSMQAWALAQYRKRHRLSEEALARWLGLSRDQLATLALCVRPDAQLPSFDTTIARIATATGCNGERLGLLLQEASTHR
jgi:hypothetical protein